MLNMALLNRFSPCNDCPWTNSKRRCSGSPIRGKTFANRLNETTFTEFQPSSTE